jgi:hypothetical protein
MDHGERDHMYEVTDVVCMTCDVNKKGICTRKQ